MITIQGFAKLCGCNTQILRYYDRIGLLAPAKVDEWTGYTALPLRSDPFIFLKSHVFSM